jgi:two-component system LytT family response regulator
MNTKISAIIVDDDNDNLQLLKYFITKFCPLVEIIGECLNVDDSIVLISELSPQLIFLDIQLNDKTAFDILDKIDFSELEIIFVTAYDNYALKAFKYNAVDYILKPLSIEDIILATNKVILKINEKQIFDQQVNNKIKNHLEKTNDFISISSLDKVTLINKNEIIFCKSDGRYTTFFLSNKSEHVACKNLGEYELILNENDFFRIHHSYIVNIKHIKNINKKSGYYCEMTNGAFLPIAKRRQEGLKQILNF